MNLKKITSLLLTLVMAVSLVPMAAFAEVNEQGQNDNQIVEQQNEENEEISSDEEKLPEEPKENEAGEDALSAAALLADDNGDTEGGQNVTPLSTNVKVYRYNNPTADKADDTNFSGTFNTMVGSGYAFEFWVDGVKTTNITPPTNVGGVEINSNFNGISGRFYVKFTKEGNNISLPFGVDGKTVTITANVSAQSGGSVTPPPEVVPSDKVQMQNVFFNGSSVEYHPMGDSAKITGAHGLTKDVAFKYNGNIVTGNVTVKSTANSAIKIKKHDSIEHVWQIYTSEDIAIGSYQVTLEVQVDKDTNKDTNKDITFTYSHNKLEVLYNLTNKENNNSNWSTCPRRNDGDTSEYIGLDYHKEAVLKIKVLWNNNPMGLFNPPSNDTGINFVRQGNKNATITDINGVDGADEANAKFMDETTRLITVKPGRGFGSTSLQISICFPNGSINYDVGISVLGSGDNTQYTESWYKDATIITATSQTADIEVCSTNQTELDAADEAKGFFIKDGKVYFNYSKITDTNKKPTDFSITDDGNKYAVVFMPTEVGTLEKRTAGISNIEIKSEDIKYFNSNIDGYYIVNYDNMTGHAWNANNVFEFENFKNVDGEYYPVYIIKRENGNTVSVDNDATIKIIDGNKNWVSAGRVNIGTADNPIDAFKVYINPPTGQSVTPTMSIDARVGLFISGEAPKELGVSVYPPEKTNLGETYGFGYPMHGTLPEGMREMYSDLGVKDVTSTEKIRYNRVISKGVGYPIKVDSALYDDIDVSTFKAFTTKPDKINITYITKDEQGDNCIGINVEVDASEPISEEIMVSFKDKAEKEYYLYDSVFIYEQPVYTSEERTVGNVADFIAAYTTMDKGTIYVKPGAYRFTTPFVHYRSTINIVGLTENNAKPVFYGPSNNTAPVITFKGGLWNSQVKNIIIDGESTRIGVYGSNEKGVFTSFSINNVEIRNCTTAIFNNTENGQTNVSDCVLRNNTHGIETNLVAPNVRNTLFEKNDVAVYIGEKTNQVPNIKNCSFVDNRTDLETYRQYEISFQQNFFGVTNEEKEIVPKTAPEGSPKGTPNGIPDIAGDSMCTGKVYYVPYYTSIDKDTLATTIAGAKVEEVAKFAARAAGGTTKYTLPVDLTANPASQMKSYIFEQIAKTPDNDNDVIVEIPVTSVDGTVNWQFNNEHLAKEGFDFTKDITNIAVSDKLSTDAANVVENKKGDAKVYQEINFAHEGKLPGKARVTVDGAFKEIGEDETLYLYHIVGDKLVLEKDADVEFYVDEEKKVNYYTATVDHCSEYIISTNIVLEEENQGGNNGGATGGSTGGATGGSTGGFTGVFRPIETEAIAQITEPSETGTTTVVKSLSANDFVSAQDVETKLESSVTGSISFDVTDKKTVSANAFKVLTDYAGSTLTLEGNGYSWTFAASDITDANAINGTALNTTISLESPNAQVIKNAAGGAKITNVYFAYHGNLPGKATVKIDVGKQESGKVKYVYYFDPNRTMFEYISELVVTNDGHAVFDIRHCSDYILSDTKLDESIVYTADKLPQVSEGNTEVVTEQPAESESSTSTFPIIAIVIAIVVAAAAVILVFKRRKEE